MNKKWIITTTIAALSLISSAWTGLSTHRQVNATIKSVENKKNETSKEIEEDRNKLGYIDADEIKLEVQDLDLTFRLKGVVKEGIVGARFRGFDVGKYDYTKTEFGIRTLKLIENQLDKYFKNGLNDDDIYLIIYARGLADNIPVNPNTVYIGDDILNVEYYNGNDIDFKHKKTVSFINGRTRMINKYFAVLRAYFIVHRFEVLYPNTKNKIRIIAEEFNEVGPQYRGCDLVISIKNAFINDYNELNFLGKFIYNL